jgi:hypothetical protein
MQAAADIALFVRPSARLEFAGLPCIPDDAEQGTSWLVVGDLGDLWNCLTLNRAFRLLYHNPEAKLLALGRDSLLARTGLHLTGCRTVCRCPGTCDRA